LSLFDEFFGDSLEWTGGFGSYLFGMSEHVANQSLDTSDFKDPKLGWIIAFLFVVSFLGLFSVVPLRKVWHILEILIIHYPLICHLFS
jgi:hypothetical protein